MIDNINLEAGYPFSFGNTGENLRFAAEGEQAEHERVYPFFAQTAEKEGYAEAARLWRMIASIEGQHHAAFLRARRESLSGACWRRAEPAVWHCLNCGYTYTSEEAAEYCPVCGKGKGWMTAGTPDSN